MARCQPVDASLKTKFGKRRVGKRNNIKNKISPMSGKKERLMADLAAAVLAVAVVVVVPAGDSSAISLILSGSSLLPDIMCM